MGSSFLAFCLVFICIACFDTFGAFFVYKKHIHFTARRSVSSN